MDIMNPSMARLIKKTPPPLTHQCHQGAPNYHQRPTETPQGLSLELVWQFSRFCRGWTNIPRKNWWSIVDGSEIRLTSGFNVPYDLGLYISTGAGFLPSSVLSTPPARLTVRPLKRPWERKTPCCSFLGRQLFRGELVNFRGVM